MTPDERAQKAAAKLVAMGAEFSFKMHKSVPDTCHEQPDDFRAFTSGEEALAYLDGLKPHCEDSCLHDWRPQRTIGEWPKYCATCGVVSSEPVAAKLLVGSMEPFRRAFPPAENTVGSIADLPVVVYPHLRPDQWVMLDHEGNVIAAGKGVE